MKCVEYWRALDKGKECGAPKFGSASRKHQELYRNGVVPDLMAMGATEEKILDLLPYTVCTSGTDKSISILRLRRDSPKRKEMLDFFFSNIMSGKHISLKSIIEAGFSRSNWTTIDYKNHYGTFNDSITARLSRKLEHEELLKTLADRPLLQPPEYIPSPILKQRHKLLNLCTTGQTNILHEMNLAGYGDDEYTAFCIALKWAAERLDSEKNKPEINSTTNK